MRLRSRCSKLFVSSRAVVAAIVAALICSGCSSVEKAKPQPQSARVDHSFTIDVPEIMRGTIGSEAVVLGYEPTTSPGYRPVIVSGYGLVVGLNGTGSRDIPPPIRAYMLALAAKGGIGSHKYGEQIGNMSPEELLNSPDTAVVVVQGIVPQGALAGERFDVRVTPAPSSNTISLEGGKLWTTDLRPGAPTTGGAQAAALAQAHGDIFVNPFAEPGAVGKDTVNRTVGRIMNGGVVDKDMPLKLRLANPSHARAAILQNAINTRFPQETARYQGDPNNQRSATARGESDELIEINVPPSYRDRTDEFIELLRHTTIQQGNPEATAMYIRRALLANPMVANAASLRWQALGKRVLPLIKDLYDYSEEVPRLAALRAGAKLDDPLVVEHLVELASHGSADVRVDAVGLLSVMGINPRIDLALRELLNDDDTEVRLQAYEALVKRHDPFLRRYEVDDKFIVDVVESDKPLIYIAQIGRPRIVLFGQAMAIDRPATVSAWSNRLMIKADSEDSQVEVYYRQPNAEQGAIVRTNPTLDQFVQFLGHATSIEKPAPGLGLTYSDTVGALYEIWTQKYIKADFKAEQDRILAGIMRIRQEDRVAERPEFTDSGQPDAAAATTAPDEGHSDLGQLPAPDASPAKPSGSQ